MSEVSTVDALARIDALVERRRFAEARALLGPALAAAPEDTELLLRAAWIDYLRDADEEALATLRSLLQRDPTERRARFLLFEVLMALGRHAEAEPVVVELLRDEPGDAELYGCYGDLMLRTLHLDKAGQLAAEGLRLDPDDERCLRVRAFVELIHAPAAAREGALGELLRARPDSARSALLLIVALQDRGDPRAALRIAQELLRWQPDSPDFLRIVRELRFATHWSLLPMWPMQRWGWGASVALWAGGLLVLNGLRRVAPPLAGAFAIVWLLYILYSWIWPPLLRRWMLRD